MHGAQGQHAANQPNNLAKNTHDRELVERAQLGDTEAFGELIAAHRDKARQWAERMTQDPHMADDIVQDALIRAFLHLGSLTDSTRFLPWLHKIIRNQAAMRLRRGGPYRHEQPFTAFESVKRSSPKSGFAKGAASSNSSSVNWDDLDSILHHLSKGGRQAASVGESVHDDPAEQLLRKEMFETIHVLLHCLNRKERQIFEAYFFKQCSPETIAEMYETTTGTVYTYLHRSRRKLREAHNVNVYFQGLQPIRGGSVMTRKKQIHLPPWSREQMAANSLVDRVAQLLAALDDPRPMAQLMGLSGFAFRMKISNRTTYADGLYIYDWRQVIPQFLAKLGYEATILCGQLSGMPVPLLGAAERFPVVFPIEESVLPFIRKYIDQGMPLLYFDTLAERPYVHEWSLVYGYDDEQRVIHLTDRMSAQGKTLRYDDVTDNPLRFLVGIDGKQTNHPESTTLQANLNALHFAVQYARQGCSYSPTTVYLSYSSGLAAYERWIGFMHKDAGVMPNRYGMSQLSLVYGEAKRQAAQYLRESFIEGEPMRLLLLGAEAYDQAAEAFEQISARMPFGSSQSISASPQTELLAACSTDLSTARDFEAAAISYIEKALLLWETERI
ncbi:RNA polymerase sigma factor (sigma-70 family) [Paenibacillus taihuensis]|uniref:RNA polymerase sigma factor n=2 Tax=Paenibacillus taihuensis TaxID=1156355 RepID=A0A3D9RTT4_9BACL|nr:RNA polymerase sigma factor (sigma-70 family) [Paenibacillus taihuensis]